MSSGGIAASRRTAVVLIGAWMLAGALIGIWALWWSHAVAVAFRVSEQSGPIVEPGWPWYPSIWLDLLVPVLLAGLVTAAGAVWSGVAGRPQRRRAVLCVALLVAGVLLDLVLWRFGAPNAVSPGWEPSLWSGHDVPPGVGQGRFTALLTFAQVPVGLAILWAGGLLRRGPWARSGPVPAAT
jgi:hypothetical protein